MNPRTGPTSSSAVAYFAKAPRPGQVKTRLCPPLTPAEAAGIYAGFLRDLLVPVAGARTLVYGWPADGLEEMLPLEVWPEGRDEHELGVGRLPQEEIAEPLFAARAVGVGAAVTTR